jgi:hypothetical protein
MKLLKQIHWALCKPRLEQDLIRYCSFEYREADRSWAFYKTIEEHKLQFLRDD